MRYRLLLIALWCALGCRAADLWPDGTPVSSWFADTSRVDISTLGTKYVLTDYGVVKDSTLVQTAAIQAVIDRASASGGGVVVVPRGTFLSGALFFKKGTHLHIEAGGKLKGIDDIRHYPLVKTAITFAHHAAVIFGIVGYGMDGDIAAYTAVLHDATLTVVRCNISRDAADILLTGDAGIG